MRISPETLNKIQQLSLETFKFLVTIRRDLHQHPELSGEEAWTAAYLANKLQNLGLTVRTGVYGHGLVADLITNPARPTVALRVDMDALPIQETNSVPYRSQIPGVMHACGHDVHCAVGIGTAAVLTQMASDLPGNIRFIFQPEEEEITGALGMIEAGVLADPRPDAIFGLHAAPLPAGQVAWTDGLFLAGFDHYLAVLSPHKNADASLNHLDTVARRCCETILDLNKFHLPLIWEAMLNFWQMMQTGSENLRRFTIYDASVDEEEDSPWRGQFGIGIKAASPRLRHSAIRQIRAVLNKICRTAQTGVSFELIDTMQDMRNHPNLVGSTLSALQAALGVENTIQLKAAFPFNCEDFAYYTQQLPGAMYWLGAADPDTHKYAMLHTPDFDVDENCLMTGTTAMAVLLLESLLAFAT